MMDTMRSPMRREPRHPQNADDTPARLNQIRISPRVYREVGVIGLGALMYFLVRGLMETQVNLALSHAESLIDIERRLGIFHEPGIQAFVMRWDWPVIIATLVWLLWKHRDAFALYRSALLISGAIGLVFFVTLPMAPPRFLADQGFIDTVTQGSNAYRMLQPPASPTSSRRCRACTSAGTC